MPIILCCQIGESREKIIPFDSKDYNPDKYAVTKCSYVHGSADIIITQVRPITKNRKNRTARPGFCRAWIEVKTKGGITFNSYFSDISPAGYSYGIFVPKKQPSTDYFITVKFGDYDGRIFLISKSGKVTESPGGEYFLTKDKRYLFVQYSSDMSMLIVFDLKKGKEICRAKDIPYIHNWYVKNGNYMFTISDWTRSSIPTEKSGTAYVYDFDSNEIKEKTGESILSGAEKIEYDFEPGNVNNCSCNKK